MDKLFVHEFYVGLPEKRKTTYIIFLD
jgi:hypothetical protein